MTRLGAIFAGGQARRFGGDKASATLEGVALLDHVARRLAGQCDELVVVGREWPGLRTIGDLPSSGLGPLGALAGALDFAARRGHGEILTSGCDLPDLPLDLADRLFPAPAVADGQPLLGLWPAEFAPRLIAWLEADRDRSMRAWIAETRARTVALPVHPSNINRPTDLETLALRLSEDRRSSR